MEDKTKEFLKALRKAKRMTYLSENGGGISSYQIIFHDNNNCSYCVHKLGTTMGTTDNLFLDNNTFLKTLISKEQPIK